MFSKWYRQSRNGVGNLKRSPTLRKRVIWSFQNYMNFGSQNAKNSTFILPTLRKSGLQTVLKLWVGFPIRFLPKPKNRVTRFFSKPKNRFWLLINPVFGFEFWLTISNYATLLIRNKSDACNMSMIQCSFSFIYTTGHFFYIRYVC